MVLQGYKDIERKKKTNTYNDRTINKDEQTQKKGVFEATEESMRLIEHRIQDPKEKTAKTTTREKKREKKKESMK